MIDCLLFVNLEVFFNSAHCSCVDSVSSDCLIDYEPYSLIISRATIF